MRLTAPSALLALALAACGGSEPAPVETPAPPAAEVPPPAPAAEPGPPAIPSPAAMQRTLAEAGVTQDLPAYITHGEMNLEQTDEDHAAVRTGVVLADMLLTVTASDKEQLLGQIDAIYRGMEQLEGGRDVLATLTEMRERVEADATTREALLEELDLLRGAVIPELEFNGRARIVPLIQAGSWLEGANLVAKAVRAAERPEIADGLLKQPEVVAYFNAYITEREGDAPAAITDQIRAALGELDAIARKEGSLTLEDVTQVITSTDAVLALL